MEDLLQEILIVFLKVKEKYPRVEPKNLMALFKVSVTNRFHRLASKYKASELLPDFAFEQIEDEMQSFVLDLVSSFVSAPKEVLELMQDLASESSQLLRCGRVSNKAAKTVLGLSNNPVTLLRQLLKQGYSQVRGVKTPLATNQSNGVITMTQKKTNFDVLIEAADFSPVSEETDQQILSALVERVNDIPEGEFESLPKSVQKWYNTAVDDYGNNDPIKNPPAFAEWRTANPAPDGEKGDTPADEESGDTPADEEKGDTPAAAEEQETGAKKSKKSQAKRLATQQRHDKNTQGKAAVTGRRRDGSIHEACKFIYSKGVGVDVGQVLAHIQSKGMEMSPTTASNSIRRVKHVVTGLLEFGWPSEADARKMIGE